MRAILFLVLLATAPSLRANDYFVGPGGDDKSGGTDSGQPFRTIQHGVDVAGPGDTVTVLDGVYPESVLIKHSGRKEAPIIIQSKNRWGAKVETPANLQDCFSVGSRDLAGVSYITIRGFDLKADGVYGSGVATYTGAHHITVENVYAHDCGSSGIGGGDGDYIVVRNCICAHNALLMPYCGSGISLYGRIEADDAPGFHNIISGNVCFGNDNGPKTSQTDGNGIIIDDKRNKQTYHAKQAPSDLDYRGDATLVENNLCFHNGGKGIIIYSTNNVTLANNTCVRDLQRANQAGDCGEISVGSSARVTLVNNIAVVASGRAARLPDTAYLLVKTNGKEYPDDPLMDGTCFLKHNLSFDGDKPGDASFRAADGLTVSFAGQDGNLAGVDPGFVDADDATLREGKLAPGTDFAGYFGLRKTSPGLKAGISVEGSFLADRAVVDLGAFQQADAKKPQ